MNNWKKEVLFLANEYGVSVQFRKNNVPNRLKKWKVDGQAKCRDKLIILYAEFKTREDMLSCFFHELGHIYCYTNKIWRVYHRDRRNKRSVLLTAFKAENWVDKWAEKMFKQKFPDLKFKRSYRTILSKKYIKHFIISNGKTHKVVGLAKRLNVDVVVKYHDMIAQCCICNAWFTYKNTISGNSKLWRCPACKIYAPISQ